MAAATGSPASRRLTKLTPLTTRPSFTSRQGMTRTLNIARPLSRTPPAPPPDQHDDTSNDHPSCEQKGAERQRNKGEIAHVNHRRERLANIAAHERAWRPDLHGAFTTQSARNSAARKAHDKWRGRDEQDQNECHAQPHA